MEHTKMVLSPLVQYAISIMPVVLMAENTGGDGAGKKEFVENLMGDLTGVMAARFNAAEELHPLVKELRSQIIDAAVHVANYRGLFQSRTEKRIGAALALGAVTDRGQARRLSAILRKQQKEEPLTDAEKKELSDFEETLPAAADRREAAPADRPAEQ